jgi:dTDP-4-amino-4,6-dideoxygalactose transaminase
MLSRSHHAFCLKNRQAVAQRVHEVDHGASQMVFCRARMHVPLLDLRKQYAPLRAAILAEMEAVAETQNLVLGPKTEAFESAVAAYCGASHALGMSSGTDAELVVLMALGIGRGDAIVTTPYTFFATAGCIARLGAQPVFADIDPRTFNISPEALAAILARTPRVKAIIPVHLFGQCAAMDEIVALGRKFGVPVLEDAAQALGARHPLGAAGCIGDAGWFSFYPTKNLGAFGDAGMTVCRDETLATKIRALRNHGMEQRYHHRWVGGNFRIDAIQAAILNVKLPFLDEWSRGRRKRAQFYRDAMTRVGLAERITLPFETSDGSDVAQRHIYNQFVVRVPHRDALRAHLHANGIGTEVYYPVPLHLQECFRDLGYRPGDFPEAERAARESLALPIFPELTEEQQTHVVEQMAAFFRRSG